MTRRCCVSGCSSNYDSTRECSFFSFPTDLNRRQLWIRQMRRKDFEVKKNSLVCIKHFEDKFIDRELRAQRDDGSYIIIPRNHPILTKDAYPTVFPNNSSRRSPPVSNSNYEYEDEVEELTTNSKYDTVHNMDEDDVQIVNELDGEDAHSSSELDLDELENSLGSQNNDGDSDDIQRWLDDDKINDLAQFKVYYQSKLPSKWLTLPSENDVYIAKVNVEHVPEIIVSMKIMNDLSFNIWCRNIPIPQKCFRWLFGKKLRIESWTRFECLLNHLNGYDKQISTDLQLKGIASLVKDCARSCSDSKMLTELLVISQQLKLISSEQRNAIANHEADGEEDYEAEVSANHEVPVANHPKPRARKSLTRNIQI